jgi:hypothetical protein
VADVGHEIGLTVSMRTNRSFQAAPVGPVIAAKG